MDEVIYLEPDEEITSAIDKIKQTKSSRINIVVPRDATLLQSVVNLKLLQKEAENLGKNIALVTADKIGRNLAARVGLTVLDSIKDKKPVYQAPTFEPSNREVIEVDLTPRKEDESTPKGLNVHHFQKAEETKENFQPAYRPSKDYSHQGDTGHINHSQSSKVLRKRASWLTFGKVIWSILCLLAIAAIVLALIVLPTAGITLQVKAEKYENSVDIPVTSDQKLAKSDKKALLGEMFDFTKEKEEKFTATGKKNLGGKASGTITLYNYWDSGSQALASGSKLSSSSKTFVTKAGVTIPGTSIRGGNIVAGTANVEIEAESPGDDYNVRAGRYTIIGLSAAQQEKIYGESQKNLTGGFSKEVTVVSNDDYNKAKEKLISSLNEELQEQLKSESKDIEVMEKSIKIETSEEKSSAAIDSEASDFTLKIKQRLRAIGFEKQDFDKKAIENAEANIPPGKMISVEESNVILPQFVETKYDQNILSLKAEINGRLISKISLDNIKKDLVGKKENSVKEYLDHQTGIAGYTINFNPMWWPIKKVSKFERSLNIKLEYVNSNEKSASSEPETLPAMSTSSSEGPNE